MFIQWSQVSRTVPGLFMLWWYYIAIKSMATVTIGQGLFMIMTCNSYTVFSFGKEYMGFNPFEILPVMRKRRKKPTRDLIKGRADLRLLLRDPTTKDIHATIDARTPLI